MTLALALHSVGVRVRLFERAHAPDEAGAGLQISPNGMRVFEALGLRRALEKVAFKPEAVELRFAHSGRTVARVSLGDKVEMRLGAPYMQVHRGDLYKVLWEAVQAQCGDCVEVGREVTDFHEDEGSVEVHIKDGSTEQGVALVGADGIHSIICKRLNTIRQSVVGSGEAAFTGHVAWRGVVPRDYLQHIDLKPVATSWMAPRSHAVTYFMRGGELVNFVGITEDSNWREETWVALSDKADLVQYFTDWHPEVRAVVEAIDTPYRWALFERPPLACWSQGRVTLLGDACHGMLPYMAQGACMAAEDAAVLAQCVQAGSSDIPAAFKRYEALRRKRTTCVQAAARRNGKLFHLSNLPARGIAYGVLAATSRLAPRVLESQSNWIWRYDAFKAVN